MEKTETKTIEGLTDHMMNWLSSHVRGDHLEALDRMQVDPVVYWILAWNMGYKATGLLSSTR